MAKICCDRCGADTNYTTASKPTNRPRSIIPDGAGEENRVHLCTACWEQLKGKEVLGRE